MMMTTVNDNDNKNLRKNFLKKFSKKKFQKNFQKNSFLKFMFGNKYSIFKIFLKFFFRKIFFEYDGNIMNISDFPLNEFSPRSYEPDSL